MLPRSAAAAGGDRLVGSSDAKGKAGQGDSREHCRRGQRFCLPCTQHLPGLGGTAQEQLRPGEAAMTLEKLLCPTCASVSPAEGTSAQGAGFPQGAGGYCRHPFPQLAPHPVTEKARRGSSGDPASITAAPVLRLFQAPAQPRTDLERVFPADVVGGLHGRHAEAEEGDAAQDALLLLVWWANAEVTRTEGLGAPAAPRQRPTSCCGDTSPSLPSRG